MEETKKSSIGTWVAKLLFIGCGLFVLCIVFLFIVGVERKWSQLLQSAPTIKPTVIVQQPTNTPIEVDTPDVTGNTIISPLPTQKETPLERLERIGKDVAGINSHVSVFKNSDGSIDIANNIQVESGETAGYASYTRKWVTEFISKAYTTGYKIRHVLVTVSFLHSGISLTRVGVGINWAKLITPDRWSSMTPYDFCTRINNVSLGEDDNNRADSTFAVNFKCD